MSNLIEDALVSVGRMLLGQKRLNRIVINRLVQRARNRPHPWSTRSPYISWSGLTDRTFNARLLPSSDWAAGTAPLEPDVAAVANLFIAAPGTQRLCPKSTCLFPAFAQYLTDGFLRTRLSNDPTQEDRRRTTSNHDIDLSPLYGRTEAQTLALRLCSTRMGERGRLKSQRFKNEEWSPFLFDSDGQIRPEFLDTRGAPILDPPLGLDNPSARVETLFAVGGDRVNAAPQTAMMNALFLREHNRLAGLLEQKHPHWDDEQVFQTARNNLIVMFIKIVIEEYINHINGSRLRFITDPEVAWTANWNRPNWMTTEFTLLYRWHSLVPEQMTWAGHAMQSSQLLLNNTVLLEGGLANAFVDQSANRATALGLGNAPMFMLRAESNAIEQGRTNKLQGYAAYRRAMGLSVPESFRELVGIGHDADDKARRGHLASELQRLYQTVDRLEYYPGLFAEELEDNSPLPSLIGAMVAMDAFSQALTNPLLSEHVWGDPGIRKATFTREGVEQIDATATLRDVLARNVNDLGQRFVSMTRAEWTRT